MSRRRQKPGLSPEDQDLWARATETVTPLSRGTLSKAALMGAYSHPQDGDTSAQRSNTVGPTHAPARPQSFRIGSRNKADPPKHDLQPDLATMLRAAPPRVDGRTHQRLKAGKLRPEARIDLHGMTLAQAHPVLVRFLISAHGGGKRLVLVITGKGKDRDDGGVMPIRRGVLRHQVPHWLHTPPLAQIVLQITPAHYRHGGDGAYYVYLRKPR